MTVKKQFTFNCQVLRRSWYSFDRTRKIERLCQPWIHPVVLRLETLDLESSVLSTKPLLHENQCGEYGSIDLSNTPDKSLAVSQDFSFSQDIWQGEIEFHFLWCLIFLCKFGYRNILIHMIQNASTNIQSKLKVNDLLFFYPYPRISSGLSTLNAVMYYCS